MIGTKLNQDSADFLYDNGLFTKRYTHVTVEYINEVMELEAWLDGNAFKKTVDGEKVEVYDSMFTTIIDYHLHNL